MNDFEISNFASKEASTGLKEVGFDEPCLGTYYYHKPTEQKQLLLNHLVKKHLSSFEEEVPSPLFTQARKWFREKHGIFMSISETYIESGEVVCFSLELSTPNYTFFWAEQPTEHEAYNAAIIAACEYIKSNTP